MHITLPTQSCSHTHICKHPICVYPSWSFFFFKNSFIYLAALGLSCGMRESSLQFMDSPVVGPNCSTVRDILVPMKVAQSCLTLCDPMDYTAHGILQARILEWVATPFSRGSSQLTVQVQVSHIAGGFFTSWATREDCRTHFSPWPHSRYTGGLPPRASELEIPGKGLEIVGCDMRPRPSANGVHVGFKMQWYFLNPRLYNLWEKGLWCSL